MKKIFLLFTVSMLIALGFAILRPVPSCKNSNCLDTTGIVTDIYEGGDQDIVFQLKDDRNVFYINRGLERGLNIESLKNELLGHEILIRYPVHRNLFRPVNASNHMAMLEYEGRTLFSELD